MFNVNRGHMAAAGNYSGNIAEKFLTVKLNLFSLALLIYCHKMEPIMEEFGILSKDIQEIWQSMVSVTL